MHIETGLFQKKKADDRTRTDNLLITNQLLCQLSHIGLLIRCHLASDSDGNRTRVTAVKGRCLNRLTTEPNSLSYRSARSTKLVRNLAKWPCRLHTRLVENLAKCYRAPRAGLEPATLRLTAECSTIELSRNSEQCEHAITAHSKPIPNRISQMKPSTY